MRSQNQCQINNIVAFNKGMNRAKTRCSISHSFLRTDLSLALVCSYSIPQQLNGHQPGQAVEPNPYQHPEALAIHLREQRPLQAALTLAGAISSGTLVNLQDGEVRGNHQFTPPPHPPFPDFRIAAEDSLISVVRSL